MRIGGPAEVPSSLERRTRTYLSFAILAAPLLVYVMQIGMVSVALGAVNEDLNAPIRWGGWVLTVFMIGQVLSLSVTGRLAERFGTRTVFAGGLALFTGASLLCALSPNIYLLIAARFVQGAGGGSLMPAGTSLIADVFVERRARAIGLYSSILPFGAVFGPAVGGAIVDAAGWQWTFMLNVPLGMVMLIAVFIVIPAGRERLPAAQLDARGVTLLAVAITATIFLLTELGRNSPGPSIMLVSGSAAVSLGAWVLFVIQERRTEIPALDIELLRRREFIASNCTAFFAGMCWIGVFSLVPLYVQSGYGITASGTGALMAPRAVFMGGVSTLAALILNRTGYRRPIAAGLLGTAVSLGLLALGLQDPEILGLRISSFWWLLALISLAGASLGLINPALNNIGMDLAPDRIASVAGLRATFQSFGGTIGISFMVLLAARLADVKQGMQTGFALFALILVATVILLVPLIPEMPSHSERRRPTEQPDDTIVY